MKLNNKEFCEIAGWVLGNKARQEGCCPFSDNCNSRCAHYWGKQFAATAGEFACPCYAWGQRKTEEKAIELLKRSWDGK